RVSADGLDRHASDVADTSTRFWERQCEQQYADGSLPSQRNFHRLHEFAFLVSVEVAFFKRPSVCWQGLIRMPDADRTADQFPESAVIEAGRKGVGVKTFQLYRQTQISLIAPDLVPVFLRQGECQIEYRAHVRPVRLTKQHARVVNDLAKWRDSL